MTYECSKCGVVSDTKEHLCAPKTVVMVDYCGSNPDRDICEPMHESVRFECSVCGRAAESKELLCQAHKIK